MIAIERDGAVASVTIRRPEVRNAIPVEGWALLAERLAEAAADGARVILLRGAGGMFSAGADLRELARLADDPAGRPVFRQRMRDGIDAVAASPIPVIAAIEGGCFGAAVAMALACDIRVASPGAVFGVPPARLGICYPQSDVDRLVAAIGRGQAARLLLSAVPIDAPEAARIGLVDAVVDDGGRALAAAIAGNFGDAVALLRRQIAGLEQPEADRLFDARFATPAFVEATAGLRRPPA